MKPFAESCAQNRDAILNVIQPLFVNNKRLLEIGSGTGQHAVYFAKEMPSLSWQTSDLEENHDGIKQWLADANLGNIKQPVSLAACDQQGWATLASKESYDAVFSANAVHIMGKKDVQCLFEGIGKVMADKGLLTLYGPFNYEGKFTSESNARFDIWLKDRNPESGIRDFEWLDELANNVGMKLINDVVMPANNRILVWAKV